MNKQMSRSKMSIEKLEVLVEREKIMSMRELKTVMEREGALNHIDEIIKTICVRELKELGGVPIEKKEVSKYIQNFSSATAQRQLDTLRKGQKVWGPWPNSLEKNTKTYYPAIEVAAVMYIQCHAATMHGQPSLSRILETRHG